MADSIVTERTCSKCGQTKPFTKFRVDKTCPSGRSKQCYACFVEYMKARSGSIPIPDTKTCSTCMIEKPSSEFNRSNQTLDGLKIQCRACVSAASSAYRSSDAFKRRAEERKSRPKQIPDLKKCGRCSLIKKSQDFYKSSYAVDGLNSYCRQCFLKVGDTESRRKRRAHYVKTDAYKTSSRKSGAKIRKTKRGQRRIRHHKLKCYYGLTGNEYDDMLRQQNGLCGICHQPSTQQHLSVDHDHQTGKVRGLLCNPCNSILGRWKDHVEIAERAVEYLKNGGINFVRQPSLLEPIPPSGQ